MSEIIWRHFQEMNITSFLVFALTNIKYDFWNASHDLENDRTWIIKASVFNINGAER